MATTRKDLRGRTLRKGEMQRSSDKRYAYSYTDPLGRRKYIYANDLVTLREKEARLTKDQMDGLDIYVAGKATVNFVFDRYMSLKTNLCNFLLAEGIADEAVIHIKIVAPGGLA